MHILVTIEGKREQYFRRQRKKIKTAKARSKNCKDETVEDIDGRKILCTVTKVYLQSNLYYDQENRILSTLCEINSSISKKSILLFHPSKNKRKHPRNWLAAQIWINDTWFHSFTYPKDGKNCMAKFNLFPLSFLVSEPTNQPINQTNNNNESR